MTDETKKTADQYHDEALAQLQAVNNAFYGAAEALLASNSDGEIKETALAVVGNIFNLGMSIASALHAIAHSQIRMVELAEADIASQVKAVAEPMAQQIVKDQSKRSFIGKKPD